MNNSMNGFQKGMFLYPSVNLSKLQKTTSLWFITLVQSELKVTQSMVGHWMSTNLIDW